MSYSVTASGGRALTPGGAAPTSVVVEMPNTRAEESSFEAAFNGGQFLHLAVAVCVLNDIYREAEKAGIPIDSVKVTADGKFEGDVVVSTGITYSVSVESPADPEDVANLIAHVDEIAEIPNTLRRPTLVTRVAGDNG